MVMADRDRASMFERVRAVLEWIALLLILAVAGYLRLANVASTPGWYSDEGTIINIAENLMQGKIQYFAIGQSMLLEARMPLFPLILSRLFLVWGVRTEVLRALTGCLGVLSTGLLYVAVRRAQRSTESSLALISAGLFAVYPSAVLYSRIGFSYNLLTPLVILALLGLWEYLLTCKRVWLMFAALSVGLGALSDLMALTLALPLVVVVSTRRWRDLLLGVPAMGLPLALYVGIMMSTAPSAFLFDLRFTLGRLGSIPLVAQFPVAMLNFAGLLGRDFWIPVGVIGLFMLQPLRLQRLVILVLMLPLFSLARSTTSIYGLGFYYVSPLFPLIALGMASLVRFGTPVVVSTLRGGLNELFSLWRWPAYPEFMGNMRHGAVTLLSALALFAFIVAPFLIPMFTNAYLIQHGILEAGEEITMSQLLIDPKDAVAVAGFVNDHSRPDDLVVASPAWAWLIDAHVADFQQSVAWRGGETLHFPTNVPRDRFEFDVDYLNARFVIVDNAWRNWAVRVMPTVREMVDRVETWAIAYKQGEIVVYQAPGP